MKKNAKKKVIDSYRLIVDDVVTDIKIISDPDEFVPIYHMSFPVLKPATEAVLDYVREKLISEMDLRPAEILSPEEMRKTKEKFMK
ncbi:hypothetical protein DRJ04_09605, partial [Candidatus Aerophobetes bacterium]